MKDSMLESLASQDVPPLPDDFQQQVHQRLNNSLVVIHLLEAVFSVMPRAVWELIKAVVGFVNFTLTGSYRSKRSGKR